MSGTAAGKPGKTAPDFIRTALQASVAIFVCAFGTMLLLALTGTSGGAADSLVDVCKTLTILTATTIVNLLPRQGRP